MFGEAASKASWPAASASQATEGKHMAPSTSLLLP